MFARAGKKVVSVSAACVLAFAYAQECKNDVLYFTPNKAGHSNIPL
ncbi:hypothetical protein VTP01DRAFT_7050 [Rhizomucor pusillus]